MDRKTTQFTANQAAWFCAGMALVTIGIATASMSHSHRLLLWVGMVMMLAGAALAAVPVVHPSRKDA